MNGFSSMPPIGDYTLHDMEPTGRRWLKHALALKNAARPGLKPRRRKYWLGVAKKNGIQLYAFTKRGVTLGNPDAVARVTIYA